MEIDGRHCETEQAQAHRANKISCRKLLAKLKEVHGVPVPQPEPDIIDLVTVVVRKEETSEAKAEARFIRYLCDSEGRKMPTVNEIKHVVAGHFKITPLNLDSKSRKAAFVKPRQIAMYLCREMTVRSLPDIARRFGGRDHTTALHAVNKIEGLIAADPATAKEVDHIREQLQ